MKLLVTGGAGYIGSVVANQLLERGHEVVVLDDLSRGHRAAIPSGARFAEVGLADADGTRDALAEGFDGVLHFAALALVAESVEFPERYHRGNFVGTLNLLDAMREHGVKRLVFSSTCATYGEPEQVPMPETLRTEPGQLLRQLQARRRPHDRRRVPRARARRDLAALLQRRGRQRRARGGPLPRDAPDPARAAGRRRHARARLRVRHGLPDARTGPRCATTSTSRTSAARTCSRWTRSGRASTRSTTSATGSASPCAR